ncbi:unnamed protein product [Victoria cruziana]
MASLQISAWSPCARSKSLSGCCSASKTIMRMNMSYQFVKLKMRSDCNTCSSQRCTPVCAFGRGGKPGKANEGVPWNPLQNIMDKFKKELTVQDVLKEQKRAKQMEFDDGDDDGGDGKGTGGGGDGSGESEDESFAGALDELLQVILAAAGFSFLYYYIINGEEFSRLLRDYIRYLFGGRKSVRLTRALDRWEIFLEKLNADTRVRPDWLEREILSTPTWWYDPEWQQPTFRRRASF